MPGRQQIPSFQIASGTTAERDNSYNIPTGSIFYNTDTSNIELSGNVVASDISGVKKITFTDGAYLTTALAGGLDYFLGRGVRGNIPSNGNNIGFLSIIA